MKLDIRHFVTIEATVDLPDECPSCKAPFVGDGSRLLTWQREELAYKSRISHDKERGGVELEAMERAGDLIHPTGFSCDNCEGFILDSHESMYVLEEMDPLMAFKLRGLLFDENVLDPEIKKKVFTETAGYHGECRACNMEAEIGTEEVPHPIDPRVHTCKKSAA